MRPSKQDAAAAALMVLALVVFGVNPVGAEFYKYVNDEGQIVFVDDKSRIPTRYLNRLEIYEERNDHLSEAERHRLESIRRDKDQALQKAGQRWIDNSIRQERVRRQSAERRKAAAERQKYLQRLETRVKIVKNRVLVPAQLGYFGKEVDTWLLLDTGASLIVLHREIADVLGMKPLKAARSQLAGGQTIQSALARLGYIRVGPITMQDARVLIIDHEGEPVEHCGLLGMNFLSRYDYDIDFGRQLVRWEP
jgi:predicted aspartyl protease